MWSVSVKTVHKRVLQSKKDDVRSLEYYIMRVCCNLLTFSPKRGALLELWWREMHVVGMKFVVCEEGKNKSQVLSDTHHSESHFLI
jgi:hypothetical protein